MGNANHGVCKRLNSNELIEFQSNIVLSKTKADLSVQAAIEKFLFQLAWAQRLATSLWLLKETGHFEYTLAFDSEFLLGDDADVIRDEALRVQQLLDLWLEHVQFIRRNFYFANFFRYFSGRISRHGESVYGLVVFVGSDTFVSVTGSDILDWHSSVLSHTLFSCNS